MIIASLKSNDVSWVHYVFGLLGVASVVLFGYLDMWYKCEPVDAKKLRTQNVQFEMPIQASCMSINKESVTFFEQAHQERPVVFGGFAVAIILMFPLGMFGILKIWLRSLRMKRDRKELHESRQREYKELNRRLERSRARRENE